MEFGRRGQEEGECGDDVEGSKDGSRESQEEWTPSSVFC